MDDDVMREIRKLYPDLDELPVLLVGGPRNGTTLTLHSDPPQALLVPFRERPSFFGGQPSLMTARYRRDRISDESHVWIYVHDPEPSP